MEEHSETEKDRVKERKRRRESNVKFIKIMCKEKCNRIGRQRIKMSPTNRKLRLPFVHTRYKLLMRALNK